MCVDNPDATAPTTRAPAVAPAMSVTRPSSTANCWTTSSASRSWWTTGPTKPAPTPRWRPSPTRGWTPTP